jgi:ribulose 1,5-bisphosphate carboxylase large subunit-like protein
MFEAAATAFKPKGGKPGEAGAAPAANGTPATTTPVTTARDEEMDALKAQLAGLQEKIDKLVK